MRDHLFLPGGDPTVVASEIVPGVYVGAWPDAFRFEGTRICVRDELPPGHVPVDSHIPVYDAERDRPNRAQLDRVADLVLSARAQGRPVLVFCGHGIRRAPLAVAWYLHRIERIDLDEAFARIRAVRPEVEHVREWVGDVRPLEEPDERSTA